MLISDLGEFGLISRLANILRSDLIGDDCAHVSMGEEFLLLTTDIMLEDVHFLRKYPPEAVGWKAISVNVSDVVGNGGKPKWALISLILPDVEVDYIEKLYVGIKEACDFYGCTVVGGNVSRSEKIGIDVFLIGTSRKPVGRKGAKPGDGLFVSGTLGDSRAGLELLRMGKKDYEDFEYVLIEKHLKPMARIDYVDHIQRHASASMDISDGLVADAEHLSERSKVRVDVDTSKLPISEELKRFCEKYRKDPVEYALFGGEDYQLLFAHPQEKQNPSLDMVQIGFISEGKGVFVDGKPAEGGYTHF